MSEMNSTGRDNNRYEEMVEDSNNSVMNSEGAGNGETTGTNHGPPNVFSYSEGAAENVMDNANIDLDDDANQMPPPTMTAGQFRSQRQNQGNPTKKRLVKVPTPSKRSSQQQHQQQQQQFQQHHQQQQQQLMQMRMSENDQPGTSGLGSYSQQHNLARMGNQGNARAPYFVPPPVGYPPAGRGHPGRMHPGHAPPPGYSQPGTSQQRALLHPGNQALNAAMMNSRMQNRFQPPNAMTAAGQNIMQQQAAIFHHRLAMIQHHQMQQQQQQNNQIPPYANEQLKQNFITNMKLMQNLTPEKRAQLMQLQGYMYQFADPAVKMAALQKLQEMPPVSDTSEEEQAGSSTTPQPAAATTTTAAAAATAASANVSARSESTTGRSSGESSSFGITVVRDTGSKGPGQHVQTYYCQHCKIVFLDQATYRIHMGTHSDSDNPFKCSLCNHSASNATEFYLHKYYSNHDD